MNSLFRLLLPLSLVALVAASCTGSFVEEMEETEATGNVPVAFAAIATDMKPDAASRAATIPGETTNDNIKSMGVFAYYTGLSEFSNSFGANFMNNQEITRETGKPWTYTPTKYWPNAAGERITFFAYSPHSSHFTVTDPEADPDNLPGGTFDMELWNNLPTLEYAPRLQAEMQTDVLIATSVMNQTKEAGPITFNFKHLLAKIVFKVKSTDPIKVTRINISGMTSYRYIFYNKDGTYELDEGRIENGKVFYSLPSKEVPADVATPVSTFFMIPDSQTQDCLLDIHYTDAGGANEVKNGIPFSYVAINSGDVVEYTIVIDKTKLDVIVDYVSGDMIWGGDGTEENIDDDTP